MLCADTTPICSYAARSDPAEQRSLCDVVHCRCRYNPTLAMLNAANVSTRGVMKYFDVSEDTAHRCPSFLSHFLFPLVSFPFPHLSNHLLSFSFSLSCPPAVSSSLACLGKPHTSFAAAPCDRFCMCDPACSARVAAAAVCWTSLMDRSTQYDRPTPLLCLTPALLLPRSIMTLGCDFDITQLVDSNLGYHVCCYKVRLSGNCATS